MKTEIIKTKIEIGEFIGLSRIDKVPYRRVTNDELKTLSSDQYVIVQKLEDQLEGFKDNKIEDYMYDILKDMNGKQQIDFYKHQYINIPDNINIVQPNIRHFDIDWESVTTIEDVKNILKVADIKFNIDFNSEKDMKIYNIVKDYLIQI